MYVFLQRATDSRECLHSMIAAVCRAIICLHKINTGSWSALSQHIVICVQVRTGSRIRPQAWSRILRGPFSAHMLYTCMCGKLWREMGYRTTNAQGGDVQSKSTASAAGARRVSAPDNSTDDGGADATTPEERDRPRILRSRHRADGARRHTWRVKSARDGRLGSPSLDGGLPQQVNDS